MIPARLITHWPMILFGTLVVALVAAGALGIRIANDRAREVVFVIPQGTVARLAAGEDITILPPTIDLVLGTRDTLIIRNNDTQPIVVGPYKIEPGQQFRQQYRGAGIFDLMCTLHESERMRVIVHWPEDG